MYTLFDSFISRGVRHPSIKMTSWLQPGLCFIGINQPRPRYCLMYVQSFQPQMRSQEPSFNTRGKRRGEHSVTGFLCIDLCKTRSLVRWCSQRSQPTRQCAGLTHIYERYFIWGLVHSPCHRLFQLAARDEEARARWGATTFGRMGNPKLALRYVSLVELGTWSERVAATTAG